MNFSPVTTSSIVVTILYSSLIAWGVWVGVRQVYQGFFKPQELLNPLFGNRQAITIFTYHLAVVSLDLFVCGPIFPARRNLLQPQPAVVWTSDRHLGAHPQLL